mmetsp:Transcript_10886/g.36328  ORF Transcript_10886/g.36328 Transcript_10886/m.36328 type:complete len:271 (+) Transcript_10886:498-1310(+)
MIFFACVSRRITSSTDVLRTPPEVACFWWSSLVEMGRPPRDDAGSARSSAETDSGVYPVIKKWHRGVGTKDATRPTRSLFMYPGYRSVVVEAAMTVETKELTWCTDGLAMRRRSTAMRFSAVLSSTTTQSALTARRFSVSIELYGCTTTSDWSSSQFGKTEYVCTSFFGKCSFNASRMYEPMPEPVPPAMECVSTKPSKESELSASRSNMSIKTSRFSSACRYPEAQLLPAPPPSFATKMFSGLNRFRCCDVWMLLTTLGSRSSSSARGM